MKKLTQLPEWQALKEHQKLIAPQSMVTWFAEDPLRFKQFSLEVGDILLDYSKNRISLHTLELLRKLASAVNLSEKIEGLFTGATLNTTENRPAFHAALRHFNSTDFSDKNKALASEVHSTLEKMRVFTDKVRNQAWRGSTGKPITDIVNIGIGGSDLGPAAATYALTDFAIKTLSCHFISNIDDAHLHEVLQKINPETTLFIISSKSFTTIETLTNAKRIRSWFLQTMSAMKGKVDLGPHFIAVTAAADKAREFGIPEEQIFPLWDWVGGRYSVWSAIGLPLALMIGMDNFLAFLNGAYAMDKHFREADFSVNMPVIMALLSIWYVNFFDAPTQALIPYAHQLNYFRAHIQQLDMESNGKRITHDGSLTDYTTGPVIWGEQGCNAQHAFHQLLHQGQHFVPIDFILVGKSATQRESNQDVLIASGLSQAQALLCGKTVEHALNELFAAGYDKSEAESLALHKSMPGNRPSNVLFLKQITPFNIGALIALYEHKVFVQGVIWDINSFDQWGVELGKQLLPDILKELTVSSSNIGHDSSTQGLIEHYKSCRS